MEAVGLHCIGELFDCPGDRLNDVACIENAIRDAVKCGKATLLKEVSFKFTPQGVTALGLISESHLSVHTWPECGYAAVDTFTCGNHADAEKAVLHLVKALGARRYHIRKIDRGLHVSEMPEVKTVDDQTIETACI